jgi:hypothetical protein
VPVRALAHPAVHEAQHAPGGAVHLAHVHLLHELGAPVRKARRGKKYKDVTECRHALHVVLSGSKGWGVTYTRGGASQKLRPPAPAPAPPPPPPRPQGAPAPRPRPPIPAPHHLDEGSNTRAWFSGNSLGTILRLAKLRFVAVQVVFETKGLKPGFHFTGSRVETRRFQAMGQLDSTRTTPPVQRPHELPALGLLQRGQRLGHIRAHVVHPLLVERVRAEVTRHGVVQRLGVVGDAQRIALSPLRRPRYSGTSCKKANFETRISLDRLPRVETRRVAVGVNWIQRAPPPTSTGTRTRTTAVDWGENPPPPRLRRWLLRRRRRPPRGASCGPRSSGASWNFESKGLKPGFHFTGSRVEPGGFKLWVNWVQTCTAPPRSVGTCASRGGPPADRG